MPARKRPRLLEEAVEADGGVPLRFSDSFAVDNQNLMLLQVPESLLSDIGEDADKGFVKLIGEADQDVVFVTGRQTFKLTKAETSNTLLLLPPEGTLSTGGLRPSYGDDNEGELEAGMKQGERREGGFEAVAAVGFQYELSKATPSLEQIRSILGACVYKGKDREASADRERLEMCTLPELQKRAQMSHRELLEGLKELEALSIEERWRMVDPLLMERTADSLLSVIVEQDMPLDKIDEKACLAALPGCEALVLKHCLRTYSFPPKEKDESRGDNASELDCFRLDLEKVACLRAHQILRAFEAESDPSDMNVLTLSDFMEQWAISMPGVDTPSKELLKGIALIERTGGGDSDKAAIVTYVPASRLPFAPAERLAALFRMKRKWPMGELEPYISDADRKAGFLLKNTRLSTDPTTGRKQFSAR